MLVLGTGTSVLPRGFSRRHGCGDSPAVKPAGIAPRFERRGGFPYRDWLRACPRTTIAWVPLAFPVTPLVIADMTWYGNINPLAIGYASRPRLRSRLTLGGRAFPRKPWTNGGRDSHSSFATHAGILTSDASTAGLPRRFTRVRTLPYRSLGLDHEGRPPWPSHTKDPAASVSCLSPVTLSAQDHLTSELLRTLSRVAASEPTSWLSGRSHILSHLARTWGP